MNENQTNWQVDQLRFEKLTFVCVKLDKNSSQLCETCTNITMDKVWLDFISKELV